MMLQRAKRHSENVKTSLVFPLAEIIKTIDLRQLAIIEVINPKPLAPWTPLPFEEIKIDLNRD